MGLGKMLGYGSKGSINVSVERPTYYPGETVNGQVFVNAREDIPCQGVVMKCSGKEKVFWQETRTRQTDEGQETYEVDFDGEKKFFSVVLPLSPGVSYIPAGQWVYPFQFQLPMDLPASFQFEDKKWAHGENNKIKAKIVYKFKGTVDVQGAFAKDLKGDCKVNMLSVPLNTVPPGKMETTKTVRLLCCIPRGDVTLSVEADKGAYYVGETANINVNVDNQSSSDIEKMKAKLYRILTLRADGHSTRFKHLMNEMQYQGCGEGDQLNQNQQLPLHGDFLPVTFGRHITCEYRIEIECSIPWAPDVELHIPVGLYQPPPQVWGYQPPADLTYYPPPPLE